MAKFFDRVRESYHTGRYRKVKELVGGRKRDLLDIGCGRPCDSMEDGSFIRYVGYGIGVDTKDCSPGFDFRKCDILDLPFPDKSFDVVVAMEVLEHVDDVDLALKNISRVLRDDGVFIMSTPNNNLLWRTVWFFWVRTVGRMWNGTHETNLKKGEWLALLGKYFAVEASQTHWHVDLIVKMTKTGKRS